MLGGEKNMQAAVFHSPDQPLTIENVPDPTPGPTDLVVEVRCCGICGSDLHAASEPGGLPQGCVMGHEFSGEVVEVGSDAREKFQPGDRVTAIPGIGCGACADCLSGDVMHCTALKITGLGQLPGAYAQYVRVGSNESVRLPDSVNFSLGALVEPLAVGLHAVKAAELEPGQDVLVLGAGPIGLAVILWSRFLGARNILVSEPAQGRRAMATALGATAVAEQAGAAAEILAERSAGGADITFECVGRPGLLAQSVSLAPARSKVVVAGVRACLPQGRLSADSRHVGCRANRPLAHGDRPHRSCGAARGL